MAPLSYLGSKQAIIPHLETIIGPLINKDTTRFGELFGGTFAASNHFKSQVKTVIGNDLELYAYIIGKALLQTVYTPTLAKVIDTLNCLTGVPGLVYHNFSPASKTKRMFFTLENAKRIDRIRIELNTMFNTKQITYKEFVFLLGSLLSACSRYSNCSGTFRAYLKEFCPRSQKAFSMTPIHTNQTMNANNKVYNMDALQVAEKEEFDVVYLDAPYTNAHYGASYSFLNYVCLYDSSVKLMGVGIVQNYNRSEFGYQKSATTAFQRLFGAIKSRYIIVSYSSAGIVSKEEMCTMLKRKGKLVVYKVWHKAYRPSSKIRMDHVEEYIFKVDTQSKPTNQADEEIWLRF